MAEFTLAERLRTGHVTRWQIVRTARQQTIAEHMYLVRSIARAFAQAIGFSDEDIRLVEQWALEHDVPEVKTGDLATPVKVAMREAVPHDDPVRRIELAMSESYAELYAVIKEQKPWIRDLVKIADTFEAYEFLRVEGIGEHAFKVTAQLRARYQSQIRAAIEKWPLLTWRAVHFVIHELIKDQES